MDPTSLGDTPLPSPSKVPFLRHRVVKEGTNFGRTGKGRVTKIDRDGTVNIPPKLNRF